MEPFTVRYTLSRRQRAGELLPWLPAAAGALGFSLGAVFLAVYLSPWFLLLVLLPVVFYRGLFALLLELAFAPAKPVEITVDGAEMVVAAAGERRVLPLEGIIQVFRSGDAWTVLHADGTALLIPAAAITESRVEFLKSFARRAAAERKSAERDY